MNRYVKISAALAAFALLLVVMGLSTSGSVVRSAWGHYGHRQVCLLAGVSVRRHE